MASPICEINSTSLGAWTDTTDGVDVALGETISVRLADSAGSRLWQLEVIGTDESVAAPAITQASVVSGVATFTAPSTPTDGWALVIRSTVGVQALGRDALNGLQAAYVSTFGVYFLTAVGGRVGALNEMYEGSAEFGWITKLNALAKAPPGAGGPPSGSAAGDLKFTFPAPGVARVNGRYFPWKGTARFAITGNIANLASFTVAQSEGTAVAGDVVLLAGQTTPSQNGLYSVGTVGGGSAALTRSTDMAASQDTLAGSVVRVTDGSVWSNTTWTLTTQGAITLGSTALQFTPDRALTVASLRLIAGKVNGETVEVPCFSLQGDGGGGTFVWKVGTQPTDDGGVNLVPSVTSVGWWQRRYAGALHAEWFGVKADTRKITDGVLTASSNVLQSATAAFTSADVGKRVLVRTPQSPNPGTVSIGIGDVVPVGTGTAFTTNIPALAGIPMGGGAIYIDGEWLAILIVADDTHLHIRQGPAHNASGVVLYRETQLETTIASVTDATHAVLAVSGATILVSGTGVLATIGTDDMAAIDNAITQAFALRSTALLLPSGMIGLYSSGTSVPNLYYQSKSGLTISGHGLKSTSLVELRRASRETLLAARTRDDYGMLSFYGCDHITVEDLSVDGSVPVLGMAHSTGGVINNSGGRGAIFMLNSSNCTIRRCGSGVGAYGTRDELFYADDRGITEGSHHWTVEDCDIEMSNNNAINPGNVGHGLVIKGNRITSAYSCLQVTARSGVVTGNIFTCAGGFYEGNGAEPVIIEQITNSSLVFESNVFVDSNSHSFSIPMLLLYGPLSDATCVCTVRGNQYVNNVGYFYNQHSAVIRVQDMRGTVTIENETFDRNTAGATGGTFIEVDGANTGKVFIGPCTMRGRAGSNMTRGVVVDATVPAGAVSVSERMTYGESITTPLDLGAALAPARDMGTAL